MDKKFEMNDIKEKKVKIKNYSNNIEKIENSEQENLQEVFNFKKSFNNFINKCQILILIISFLLILISSYFLFKSYKPLSDNNSDLRNQKLFKEIGINVIISGFFFSFIPVFFIKNLIPKFYIIFISIYYFIIFYFNNGNTYKDHGIYNNIGFYFVTSYFTIIYLSLIWIFQKISNKLFSKIFIFISFLIILLFLYLLFYIYNKNFLLKIKPIIIIKDAENIINDSVVDINKECLKWGYGLGGKRLENKEESLKNNNSCYMQYPNKCYRFIYDNVFDYSKKQNINCSNLNINSRKRLINTLQNYNNYDFSSTYNFGYPKTNIITSNNDRIITNFGKIVLKNIYDLDNKENNNKNPEISVSFDNEGKGTVKINIERNETLIKEKSIKYEKIKKNIKYENIFMIYLDSLGRELFYRKLPKTRQLLENYYWDNKQKLNKATSFQFFKYQNFGGWTDINVTPMLYGKKFIERGYNIVHYYNERGYISLQAGGDCSQSLFGLYDWNIETLKGFYFDYELISLFCDPNFIDLNDPFSDLNNQFGPYSIIRNCLYGKDAFEYIFEYAKQFISLYKNQPKFMRIWFEDAHEDTQEKIKYIDHSLSTFIQFIIDNYFIQKNLIIFVSDHGRSFYNFGQKFIAEDGIIEKPIGVLFLIYNDKDNYYNKSGLILNEQKFITPYDIFMTMLLNFNDIEENVKNNKGQELDIEIDGMKRNCYTYDDYNVKGERTETFCRCINF